MTVANCRKCRKIFQRTTNPLCSECHQQSLNQVSNAYRFIQENPHLTLEEVSDHCQIPYKELETMLFDGKLGTAAGSVIYHCQRCTRPMSAIMRRGRFCMSCADKIENQAGLNLPDKKEPERKANGQPRFPRQGDEERTGQPIEAAGMDDEHEGAPYADDLDNALETLKPASPASTADSYGFKRISEG